MNIVAPEESQIYGHLGTPGKMCYLLVRITLHPMAPSPADSEAFSRAVTPEALSDKISRLHRSGEEYSAAFHRYINKMGELGLEREDTTARSQTILDQALLGKRQEEETLIEQAEALLAAIRGTKDMEGDDMGGNREEEVREIPRRKQ